MASNARTVFQLPHKGTWFENIAVTSTGTILATRLDVPELMEINPATGTGETIVTFPGVKSITGITELTKDVFALAAGTFDLATGNVDGSYGIWTVDLKHTDKPPTLVVKIPEAGLLNGLDRWDADTVLAADSTFGKIYRVNIKNSTYLVALDDDLLKPASDASSPIGVNGLKVLTLASQTYIYFSNSTRQSFYRIPVSSSITPLGAVEILAEGFMQDDFAIRADGTAYVTTHLTNMIMKVAPGGGLDVIAGDVGKMDVAGCCACAFGRGDGDQNVLYVVTEGGSVMAVHGQTEPAKVVAIDLGG